MSDQGWANWNVLPTLFRLANAPRPVGIDGLSMAVWLRGKSTPGPGNQVLFRQFNEGELRQAVMQDNWKLIRLKKSGQPERLELCNLSLDLEERNNVAGQNPAMVKALT